MKDLNIILDYIHEIQSKNNYRIIKDKETNKLIIKHSYNTNFTCETIYIGSETPTNYSVYLIYGDFMPFLFSNNKIYKVKTGSLFDYIENGNHKLFLYNIQQENEGTENKEE